MNGLSISKPRILRQIARTGGPGSVSGNDLTRLSRRSLLELVLFLALSTLFFSIRHVDLLAPLTENVRELLGCPPPPILTTLAVAGYTLSAAILVRGRIISGAPPSCRWWHLCLWVLFYFFYAVANALPENFMGVFVAGLFLFTLEQLHLWTYGMKSQPAEKTLLGKT